MERDGGNWLVRAKGLIQKLYALHPSHRVRVALNCAGIVILLCIAIYLEMPRVEKTQQDKCDLREDTEAGKLVFEKGQSTATGYRDVRSRRVTIVYLKQGEDPQRVLNNVCEQRWFMSRLVSQLATSGAAVIVLDKAFGPDSCPDDDPGTRELRAALNHISVPVVVGRSTHSPEKDSHEACLIRDESLNLANDAAPNDGALVSPILRYGLIRLNSDVRKIPISWLCYRDEKTFKSGQNPREEDGETISWTAATLADADLAKESSLAKFRADNMHPFTSFIPIAEFSHTNALSILCSSARELEIEERYRIDCANSPRVSAEIRGRVVVVGEDVPGRDIHKLYGSDTPGVYLQANYIESLLDGRYLRPIPRSWSLTLFAVALVLLYALFWMQPEFGLVAALLLAGIAKLIMLQLLIWKGIYPPVGFQELGLVAIFLKYIDARGHASIHSIHEE